MHITVQNFRDALAAAVAEKGSDYRYPEGNMRVHPGTNSPMCSYVTHGRTDCIIGNALHRLGVSIEVLLAFEGKGADQVIRAVVTSPVPTLVLDGADEAQSAQDTGGTWDEALQAYDAIVQRGL